MSDESLSLTVSLVPRFGAGVQFRLEDEEVREVLRVNGYSDVTSEHLTDCGLTGYSKTVVDVTDPNGNRVSIHRALDDVFKKRIVGLLKGDA